MAWSSTDGWPGTPVLANRRLAALLAASAALHALALAPLMPAAGSQPALAAGPRSMTVFMIRAPAVDAVDAVAMPTTGRLPALASAKTAAHASVQAPAYTAARSAARLPGTAGRSPAASSPAVPGVDAGGATDVGQVPASLPVLPEDAPVALPVASDTAAPSSRSWSPFGHSAAQAAQARIGRAAGQGPRFAPPLQQPVLVALDPCAGPDAHAQCPGDGH